MIKAKEIAETKQAEDDVKVAAEQASEDAAIAQAQAEEAQRALAMFLSSDESPTNIVQKAAMEPTHCALPLTYPAHYSSPSLGPHDTALLCFLCLVVPRCVWQGPVSR